MYRANSSNSSLNFDSCYFNLTSYAYMSFLIALISILIFCLTGVKISVQTCCIILCCNLLSLSLKSYPSRVLTLESSFVVVEWLSLTTTFTESYKSFCKENSSINFDRIPPMSFYFISCINASCSSYFISPCTSSLLISSISLF